MRIKKSFKKQLNDCREGKISACDLIKNNSDSIRNISNYFFNRNKRFLYLNDEDDFFQEACFWMIDSIWKWDPDKNTKLEDYILYNIGARIESEIRKEKRQKRGGGKVKIDCEYLYESKHYEEKIAYVIDEQIVSGEILNKILEKGKEELGHISLSIMKYIFNGYKLHEACEELYKEDYVQRKYNDFDLFKKDVNKFVMKNIKQIMATVII